MSLAVSSCSPSLWLRFRETAGWRPLKPILMSLLLTVGKVKVFGAAVMLGRDHAWNNGLAFFWCACAHAIGEERARGIKVANGKHTYTKTLLCARSSSLHHIYQRLSAWLLAQEGRSLVQACRGFHAFCSR